MFALSPRAYALRLELRVVAFKALQPGQLLPICQAVYSVKCRGMTVMQFSRAALSDPQLQPLENTQALLRRSRFW